MTTPLNYLFNYIIQHPPTPIEDPGYLDWGPLTIESILSSVRIMEDLRSSGTAWVDNWQPQDNANRPGLLASVIVSVFADGLSRAGVDKLYKTQGNPSPWTISPYEKEDDFDRRILEGQRALRYLNADGMFLVEFAVSGLNYTRTLATMLAIVVLFLHTVVALLHTVWTTARGKSSAYWDSTTEIMVLAQNSKPALQALENTAAGLQYSSTYATKVIIRPTKLSDTQEADHLEFLLKGEEANAEDEMDEMLPPNSGPSQTAKRSVVLIDKGSLDAATTILRPSTWPTYRRQNSTTFTPFSGLSRGKPPSSSPRSQDSCVGLRSRVKDDHAYG